MASAGAMQNLHCMVKSSSSSLPESFLDRTYLAPTLTRVERELPTAVVAGTHFFHLHVFTLPKLIQANKAVICVFHSLAMKPSSILF